MTAESWDIDQAVTRGPLDEDLEGFPAFFRYGVTGIEEVAGEPLAVALAQEEADIAEFTATDDQWVFVDVDDVDSFLEELQGDGPEAAALHVLTP
jgi:hypothetical protein